jgi:alkylation response protein AidB-like acyl-CoA dehydrogenase
VTQLLHDFAKPLESLAEAAAGAAGETDRSGEFPQAVIRQFRASGLAGLLVSAADGGSGDSLRQAAHVVERLARACGSTAMIVTMHYAASSVIAALGACEARQAIGRGEALATLAFSEGASRSHFWAPVSSARADGDAVLLDARKSWITSASHADLYVWSSQALSGQGSSLWLVPRATPGIAPAAPFDGLGLRGNDSAPVTAEGARIPATALLGEDGKGGDVILGTVLPVFTVLAAAASLGLMRAAIERTVVHASATRFEHLEQSLCGLPTVRAYIARMQLKADMVSALIGDTLDALENPGEQTMLRVLEVKAAAGEGATEVTDLAMRVCGGAAFRNEVGLERIFRDARASTVMAPTTDQLYDFIGRALCGLDLFT